MSNTQTQAISAVGGFRVDASGNTVATDASGNVLADHEYFAITQEIITLGRDPVTSLSTEPAHVFDLVWNMDLNAALNTGAAIRPPRQLDANELSTQKTGLDGSKYYTVSTEGVSKQINAILSGITSLTYTNVYPVGQGLTSPNTSTSSEFGVFNALSSDGSTFVVVNRVPSTVGRQIWILNYELYVFTLNSSTGLWVQKGSMIPLTDTADGICLSVNSDGSVIGWTSTSGSTIYTFKYTTDWVTNGNAIVSQSNFFRFNKDGTLLISRINPSAYGVEIYERLTGTTWTKKGLTIPTSFTPAIDISQDGLIVLAENKVYSYGGSVGSAWVARGGAIPMDITSSGRASLSSTGNTLACVKNGSWAVYDYSASTWTQRGTTLSIGSTSTDIYMDSTASTVVVANRFSSGTCSAWVYKYTSGYALISQITLVKLDYTYTASSLSQVFYSFTGGLSSDGTRFSIGGLVYNIDTTTRVGTGTTEAECMVSLAKQLKVTNLAVTLLAADGSANVGSTITSFMAATANSSGVAYSLSDGTQSSQIIQFMTNLKTATGSYKWYDLTNGKNRQTVTTQMKFGLVQLFDRDPQLNNMIGSAVTAGAFLDSSKIETKLQLGSDLFYQKMFSETQLKEVLEAVADRGTRITVGASNNLWAFQPGDSISAIVRMIDSDSTSTGGSQNSDRWLITLQQI